MKWVHSALKELGSEWRSIKATVAPRCANSVAAVQPAMLAPTTAT
ncbi:MAG TPA: hypothetical protein VNA27_09040 [Rubrobacteraceae bacterium]|nr:hypothetical protein [Rubrobacteraceae bacterium]